jgi:hypothetical protein
LKNPEHITTDLRKADTWALGMSLYNVMEEIYPSPYNGASGGDWPLAVDKHWNKAVNSVLTAATQPLPENRPLPSGLLQLPWFIQNAEDNQKPAPPRMRQPTSLPLRRF